MEDETQVDPATDAQTDTAATGDAAAEGTEETPAEEVAA